jgi:hypothetical protein
MTPLVLLTIGVILVATPASIGASWFLWRLYREDRENRLTLVLAAVVTASTVAGVLLAIPTVFFIFGRPLPIAGQLILVALDILLPLPTVVAVYLRLLKGRP